MSLLAPRKLTRLLVALVPLASAAAAGPQEPGDDGGVQAPPAAEDLPGGAHLILLDGAGSTPRGRAEGLLLFEVGEVHEPAGRSGLLEVLAQALRSGGSVLYDGHGLDAWLKRSDATLEITCDANELEIAFSAPTGKLGGLLDRVGSLLTTPSYPATEVDAARQRLLDRLAREHDDAGALADRALLEVALGSSCAWARCASPAEVRNVSRAEVLGFHRAHLGPANLWIGLSLSGDTTAAREAIEHMVTSLPRATTPIAPAAPVFARSNPGPISIVDLPEAKLVELRVAVPAPPDAEEAAALGLWFDALGLAGDEQDARLDAARKVVAGLHFAPLYARRTLQPLGWVASGRAPAAQAPAAVAALIELLAGDLKRPVSDELLAPAREVEPPRGDDEGSLLRERVRDAAAGFSRETRARAWREQRELETGKVRTAVRTRLPTRPPVLVVVGPARALVEPLEGLAPVMLLTGQADPVGTPEGLALRARLLRAVGGSELWARLGGVALTGEVTYTGSERPVPVHIWRDLLGRRLRLEHTQGGVKTTIVVTPQAGWSRAIQAVYDLPREQWERTLYRERRQLVRVLHDLASDPRLESRRGSDGRLEVHSRDGLLCWIELDDLDRPTRLGYAEPNGAQSLYVYAGWIESQGYLWPSRVTQPQDGTVFEWSRFAPADTLDNDLFDRPAR